MARGGESALNDGQFICGVPPWADIPHNSMHSEAQRSMHAYVYKSQRKADTYLYLARRDDFSPLSDTLREQLGTFVFVLDVSLTPDRKLARGNTDEVRANLQARGFHLQFPPTAHLDPMTEDWGTDA